MEIKRTTEIFVETQRRFVIRQPETSEQVVCSECAEPMITAEAFAAFVNVSSRAVYRAIENSAAHFTETETGVLLVCLNQLAEILANKKVNNGV